MWTKFTKTQLSEFAYFCAGRKVKLNRRLHCLGSIKDCHDVRSGFTLIELLCVLTIVGILTVLSVPAISGLSASGNTDNAVSGISLLLDQARAYAMAHNTYVWVGFAQNSGATAQELTVAVIAGTTGQSSDISSESTYTPITKTRAFNNFELNSAVTGLNGMNTTSYLDVSKSSSTFKQSVGGGSVTFTSAIQYDAQGEASIGTTTQWIQIGLQPIYGNVTSNSNIAAFQVATLTGQVAVFRH
jgi:prepilin-type N-terminal cleavage/methylation domain-containing protein